MQIVEAIKEQQDAALNLLEEIACLAREQILNQIPRDTEGSTSTPAPLSAPSGTEVAELRRDLDSARFAIQVASSSTTPMPHYEVSGSLLLLQVASSTIPVPLFEVMDEEETVVSIKYEAKN